LAVVGRIEAKRVLYDHFIRCVGREREAGRANLFHATGERGGLNKNKEKGREEKRREEERE